jgi:hypothetical protein
MPRRLIATALIGLILALGAHRAHAQQDKRVALASGVAYLKGKMSSLAIGEQALSVIALHSADVPNNDPSITTALNTIFACFTPNGYVPVDRGGKDIYEAAVVCMALSSLEPVKFKEYVTAVAQYIVDRQKPDGCWGYANGNGGDSSITQYALLALWEADGIGVQIPPRVWDNAASWFLSNQLSDGGWNYRTDSGAWPETVSMTCAGVGSLLLCDRQLTIFRRGNESVNSLLVPLVVEGTVAASYKPVTTRQATMVAVRRGMEWLARRYNPTDSAGMGQSTYYGLYSMERVAAFAQKEKDLLKGLSQWYERGLQYVLSTQKSDGSWNNQGQQHGEANTPWAILFTGKATAEKARIIEIRRLGSGTLLGGRGLPENLDNMMIAQGRVVVKPMNGAVEGMIAVLEDPRATNADTAFAGLVERYQKNGPASLRPYKDRFRKLMTDRDPGIRRVACWALARTADLDVAPLLIRSLLDQSPEVVAEARVGLELLSRKVDSYGPPYGATGEQKLEAARRWRGWYEENRPPELDALDDPGLGLRKQAGGQQ